MFSGGVAKQSDPSGALLIHPSQIQTQPFEGREDVRVQDLTTLEEAPRMGAGLMELLDRADFEWTLTYDEYDYVMEGTLEIVLDSGQVLTGQPGDVLYIPKIPTSTSARPHGPGTSISSIQPIGRRPGASMAERRRPTGKKSLS